MFYHEDMLLRAHVVPPVAAEREKEKKQKRRRWEINMSGSRERKAVTNPWKQKTEHPRPPTFRNS